ncbi:MAG: glutamate--cysteine ligase [Spirochaetales bacterium]|nr:glutamate--cysteine ligase [Spirochaetales bacterium]
MKWDYFKMLKLFSKNCEYLSKTIIGLEKETLRVTSTGDLALTPHPPIFGDKTKNTMITTDFSESQMELITPPLLKTEKVYESLTEIQNLAAAGIGNELLWPLSMPAKLPEDHIIPLAKFNNSKEGLEKEMYREGLSFRYGKRMQMISGIHYNFSLSDSFWDFLYKKTLTAQSRKHFINSSYAKIARNFLRYRWLLLYLFGASPVADKSFKQTDIDQIEAYKKYITTLRMSRFGYAIPKQENIPVSFNSLGQYISDIEKLLLVKDPNFSKLGVYRNGKQIQLNDNILQNEKEFYAPVRFKRVSTFGESNLQALKNKGVEYLELRTFDLNPFEHTGIELSQLQFVEIFMLYCLFEKSPPISDSEKMIINANDHLTALSGRKPDLGLHHLIEGEVKLKDWAEEILYKMYEIGMVMDKNGNQSRNESGTYRESIKIEQEKLRNPELLPSARIVNEMNENRESFLEFGLRKANQHLLEGINEPSRICV